MSKRKKIPAFKNEAEERKFWETHDSTDYIDWSNAKRVHFPNLKPSTKSISIRLPESLLEEIKILANKRDVPYQSLIKILIHQSLHKEKQVEAIIISNLFKKLIESSRELPLPKPLDAELGILVKSYREAKDLDLEEFSEKINMKKSELRAIEKGKKSFKNKNLEEKFEKVFLQDKRDAV